MDNVAEVSSRLAAEHKKISDTIQKALAKGDNASMMQAGLALSDYLQKSAMVTKTVGATARGLETLTRLQ